MGAKPTSAIGAKWTSTKRPHFDLTLVEAAKPSLPLGLAVLRAGAREVLRGGVRFAGLRPGGSVGYIWIKRAFEGPRLARPVRTDDACPRAGDEEPLCAGAADQSAEPSGR